MSYIIWFLFVFLGAVKSDSKIVNALQKTWVVVMWGMANDIADIDAYRMHFIVSKFDFTPEYLFLKEGIYRNFCCLFRTIGVSFDTYLIILALFCVLVIDKTMDDFAINQKGLVWSALMLYPMHEFNVVLQGRLAFCVIMLGLRFLKKNSITNMIIFGLYIIFAGCIHTGAYEFFLLFAVYLFKDKSFMFKITGSVVVVEFVLINRIKNWIYGFNVEDFRLIDPYFAGSVNHIKAIGHIILFALVILIATYGYRGINKNDKIDTLHKVMWAMMLGYPLIALSTQFRRNLEMMFFIPYMCIAYNVSNMTKLENRAIWKFITMGMATVVFFALHIRNLNQFKVNYISYVMNGNYVSQGIELALRLPIILMIFMLMILFTEKYIQTRRITWKPKFIRK